MLLNCKKYLTCLLSGFFALNVYAQELVIQEYDNSKETPRLISVVEYKNQSYIGFSLVSSKDESYVHTKIVHIGEDLQEIAQQDYKAFLANTIFSKNDSIFLVGFTTEAHAEGRANWKVWYLNDSLQPIIYKNWAFSTITIDKELRSGLHYKSGLYYGLIVPLSENEAYSEIIVLDSNLNLIDDFKLPVTNRYSSMAIGDSTFAFQGTSVQVFNNKWQYVDEIKAPEKTQPIADVSKGFIPNFFGALLYSQGNYIASGTGQETSVSLATGRPTGSTNKQIYSVVADENGKELRTHIYGKAEVNEEIPFNKKSFIEINKGNFLVGGNVYPEEENGNNKQIQALRLNSEFDYPSDINGFGETDKYYGFEEAIYFKDRQEVLLIGRYSDCLFQCPRYGNFILRLRGEALATNIVNFNALNKIAVYPNPSKSKGKVNLSWSNMASHNWQVSIYDNQGGKVYDTAISQGKTISQITLPQLPKGTYILHATGSGKQVHTGSLLVE